IAAARAAPPHVPGLLSPHAMSLPIDDTSSTEQHQVFRVDLSLSTSDGGKRAPSSHSPFLKGSYGYESLLRHPHRERHPGVGLDVTAPPSVPHIPLMSSSLFSPLRSSLHCWAQHYVHDTSPLACDPKVLVLFLISNAHSSHWNVHSSKLPSSVWDANERETNATNDFPI
ncbi:hypothetical protein J6590_096075, partial [Homalodisca vitripennis]